MGGSRITKYKLVYLAPHQGAAVAWSPVQAKGGAAHTYQSRYAIVQHVHWRRTQPESRLR